MKKQIERRWAPPPEVETRADGTIASISGYAAVFYDPKDERTEFPLNESVVERISRGAFDAAIEREDFVAGLFNHDPNMLLGTTRAGSVSLSVDKTGLRYSIRPGNTTVARDVAEWVTRGEVTGSSFAFQVDKETFDHKATPRVRNVDSVTLFDVGPVLYPAYDGTTAEAASREREGRRVKMLLDGRAALGETQDE